MKLTFQAEYEAERTAHARTLEALRGLTAVLVFSWVAFAVIMGLSEALHSHWSTP